LVMHRVALPAGVAGLDHRHVLASTAAWADLGAHTQRCAWLHAGHHDDADDAEEESPRERFAAADVLRLANHDGDAPPDEPEDEDQGPVHLSTPNPGDRPGSRLACRPRPTDPGRCSAAASG